MEDLTSRHIFFSSKDKIPIENIQDSITSDSGVNLLIKREDLLHPFVSGNKFRKLKYNLVEAKRQNASRLITFGGAYSNHILAVAAAGYENNFQTTGIIRGEETQPLNPTLAKAQNSFGMKLYYANRSSYRTKSKEDDLLHMLGINCRHTYIIPEGGTNTLAVKGCAEIVEDLQIDPDFICCSCGTGGTLAGIICAVNAKTKVTGFSALKGDFLKDDIEKLVNACNNNKHDNNKSINWEVNTDFHFGGYAKFNDRLIEFINHFRTSHGIPLDPIYTGKMMYGIYALMKSGYFKKGDTVLAIHTGGLQGIEGFNQRFGKLIRN